MIQKKKVLADFSDGISYVRPFVIFRDCIQKVIQFTEPAVINYGLCVLKDYYYFMKIERPIINTSLVLDPPFRYHVTDSTCNRANVRCMDFLRKVSSFQFMYSERSMLGNRKAAAEIYYDYLGCKLEQRLIVAKKETIKEYCEMIQKGDITANMFERLRLLVTLEMKVFHKSIYILQDEAMTETVDALVEDGIYITMAQQLPWSNLHRHIEYLSVMLAFRDKARPQIKIEIKDKKDSSNIAKKFDIAERHVSKIEDKHLLDMIEDILDKYHHLPDNKRILGLSMDSMKRLLVNQWVGYTHTCFDGSILDCLRHICKYSRNALKWKFLSVQGEVIKEEDMSPEQKEIYSSEIGKYFKLSRGNVNRITTVTEYTTVRETKIERDLEQLTRSLKNITHKDSVTNNANNKQYSQKLQIQ